MEAVINWYEHHIKDYDSATMHLSWEEDLAYTRLLRWYYRKEEPIPGDLEQACRIVRAATDLQRVKDHNRAEALLLAHYARGRWA